MAVNETAEAAYDRLRRLATGDPKRAREEILKLIAERPDLISDLLVRASRPGEGRVRQLAATTARVNPTAGGPL
jgi:hypothetical protein